MAKKRYREGAWFQTDDGELCVLAQVASKTFTLIAFDGRRQVNSLWEVDGANRRVDVTVQGDGLNRVDAADLRALGLPAGAKRVRVRLSVEADE